MTLELSDNPNDVAGESAAAVLSLSHEFPQPGEELKVYVTLPEVVAKTKSRFVLSVSEFDTGKTVLASEFTCKPSEGLRAEVSLMLPTEMDLGYHSLVLYGPRKQELAREMLIVVDAPSLQMFDHADAALQCMLDASEARRRGDPRRAVALLKKGADLYGRAESPQCAGLALASAAGLAATVEPRTEDETFEQLGWDAVKFLLIAGDVEGASDVTRRLVAAAGSISDAVSHYVERGRAALEAESTATGMEQRRQAILSVAANSLPQPSRENLLEKMLVSMGKSEENHYPASLDELLYLLANVIAVYSRGVLFRNRRGFALHSITFVSRLPAFLRRVGTKYAASRSAAG